jgi:predicted XRE-type DNA-binding protein
METQWFDRGWGHLEDDGRQAREMELRSRLLMNLQQGITDKGWKRDHACRWLDLSAARVDALLAGKIGAFSLDDLVALMEQADIHWRVSQQDKALLDHLIREQRAGTGA